MQKADETGTKRSFERTVPDNLAASVPVRRYNFLKPG